MGIDQLRLLAILLSQPEAESLEALEEMATRESWLMGAVEELQTLPLELWQEEHTRLFVNGFPRTICPPFESAWRDSAMIGHVATEIAGIYLRVSLEPISGPPDYLGTMLECAVYLLSSPDESLRPIARELWDQHLAPWVPEFAQVLQRESRLKLYQTLGLHLSHWFPQ